MDTKELAARRLSGALGREVAADDVVFTDDEGLVHLADGSVYALEPGNTAYKAGDGSRQRNGRPG